jgi:hypothetical protein
VDVPTVLTTRARELLEQLDAELRQEDTVSHRRAASAK